MNPEQEREETPLDNVESILDDLRYWDDAFRNKRVGQASAELEKIQAVREELKKALENMSEEDKEKAYNLMSEHEKRQLLTP